MYMKPLSNVPGVSQIISLAYKLKNSYYRSQYHEITRSEFIQDVKFAIKNETSYAAGKLGGSQQRWMYYEYLIAKNESPEKIKNFEENELIFHGFNQAGIFPPNTSFYLEYNKFYIEHVKNLDCVGIFYFPWELDMFKYYQVKSKKIDFKYQQPDFSVLSTEDNSYLPFFRGKKILLIAPFADFLAKRATKETFEAAWAKTGEQWFYPESIDSLEFPYGFEKETQEKYATAIDLFEDIKIKIKDKDFDIALISAAGLAIPLASYVKSLGKFGFDLGGMLQFTFGVYGKRWTEGKKNKYYKEHFFNEHWVNVPDNYKPTRTDVCDSGAYW
jgi:hypothetical protein